MRKAIDINFVGTLQATFAFLPLIREGGLKKVVSISSGMADIGRTLSSPYHSNF